MESNSKICPSCNQENDLTAKFCNNCGYRFEENSSDSNIEFINEKLNELYKFIESNNTTNDFKDLLKNNGLSNKDGEEIRKEIENIIKSKNIPKNIEYHVKELVKLKAKDNALELLDLIIGNDANRFMFKSRLYGESLSRDPHGFNIYNQLKKEIEAGIVTKNNFNEEYERLIKKEIENKNTELKNRLNRDIGEDEINPDFIEKFSKYDLTEEDVFLIKKEMIDKIESKHVSLDDYDSVLKTIIDEKSLMKSEEIKKQQDDQLKNKLRLDLINLLGNDITSIYFEKKLKSHHLTTIDGNNIKEDLISLIDNSNIGENQLEDKLDEIIEKYEYDDVKKELNKLSSKEIDQILSKNSISTFIPLKFTKIEKLMYSVKVSKIKQDLILMGVQKYSNLDEESNLNNECPKCGFNNKETAKFCIKCGYKFT